MFGRRSRRMIAAEAAAKTAEARAAAHAEALAIEAARPPRIDVTEERAFAIVLERLQELVGEEGSWTLARRSDSDTEEIFHDMAARSLARAVTASLMESGAPAHARVGEAELELGLELAPDSELASVSTSTAASAPAPSFESASSLNSLLASSPAPQGAARTLIELDTVAVWADPKRHDPAFVDERLLRPAATEAERRNA